MDQRHFTSLLQQQLNSSNSTNADSSNPGQNPTNSNNFPIINTGVGLNGLNFDFGNSSNNSNNHGNNLGMEATVQAFCNLYQLQLQQQQQQALTAAIMSAQYQQQQGGVEPLQLQLMQYQLKAMQYQIMHTINQQSTALATAQRSSQGLNNGSEQLLLQNAARFGGSALSALPMNPFLSLSANNNSNSMPNMPNFQSNPWQSLQSQAQTLGSSSNAGGMNMNFSGPSLPSLLQNLSSTTTNKGHGGNRISSSVGETSQHHFQHLGSSGSINNHEISNSSQQQAEANRNISAFNSLTPLPKRTSPTKQYTVEERKQIVEKFLAENIPVKRFCKLNGLPPTTFCRWRDRYVQWKRDGLDCFQDRRGPQARIDHQGEDFVTAELQKKIAKGQEIKVADIRSLCISAAEQTTMRRGLDPSTTKISSSTINKYATDFKMKIFGLHGVLPTDSDNDAGVDGDESEEETEDDDDETEQDGEEEKKHRKKTKNSKTIKRISKKRVSRKRQHESSEDEKAEEEEEDDEEEEEEGDDVYSESESEEEEERKREEEKSSARGHRNKRTSPKHPRRDDKQNEQKSSRKSVSTSNPISENRNKNQRKTRASSKW
jgi:hypothetical protein